MSKEAKEVTVEEAEAVRQAMEELRLTTEPTPDEWTQSSDEAWTVPTIAKKANNMDVARAEEVLADLRGWWWKSGNDDKQDIYGHNRHHHYTAKRGKYVEWRLTV